MSAENIKAKALKCIDEIYPSADTLNDTYFPVDDFLGEAVRWAIDILPVHIFTKREQIAFNKVEEKSGVLYLTPASEVGRVVYVRCPEWARPADIIYEDSPLYRQQKNIALRGTPLRPIVVRMMDGSIEAYTTKADEPRDTKAYHIPYDAEYIPEKAEDICAWKLAEIVLMSMSDAQNAAVCTARVNELLEQIVL
jgi:hypothetical protein